MHVYLVYALIILGMYLYKILVMETGPYSNKALQNKRIKIKKEIENG